MHFHHREHLEAVAELGIPDIVILTYGSAMVTRGFRPPHLGGDIDFVTTLQGNLYLEEKLGFTALEQTIGTRPDGTERTIDARRDANNQFDSHRWAFSAVRHKLTGKGRMYIPELMRLSDEDDQTGILVLGRAGLLLQKVATGRPQDKQDILHIEAYDRK